MMTPMKIITELLKREGKKKQVDKAQMTETVGHLADMYYEKYHFQVEAGEIEFAGISLGLYKLGEKRAKKKMARAKQVVYSTIRAAKKINAKAKRGKS